MASWESHIPEMEKLWATMKITRDASELERVEKKIRLHQDVYQKVEKDTGVPWQMVAVIHLREAGEQDIGRWTGVLHNGENIVGKGRKTRLVPAGRGPFATWHEAALDALKLEGLTGRTGWTPGKMLAALEPFNGMGYRSKGLRSPYIWASTNHQQPGKYIRDGVFDGSVLDTQVGCAAQLKYLGVGTKATTGLATGTVAGTVGGATAWTFLKDHPWEIATGAGAVALLVWFVLHRINKYKERHVNDQQDLVSN